TILVGDWSSDVCSSDLAQAMKIATIAGYWSAGPPAEAPDLFAAADRLELDQIWTAEAWGSDAWTPLAWHGSRTRHVHLGTAVSRSEERRVGEERRTRRA